jgi:hypothetical protein
MRKAGILVALALALSPGASLAAGLNVDLWTDKGNEAVYQPGDRMKVNVRTSADSYVLVYEIDAEGTVRLLFPDRGGPGFLEGRQTVQFPPDNADVDLVVQQQVGQCYIVAIASTAPFDTLPWYLRPYNAQAEAVGYVGGDVEEQGVTAEGKIVGDPFVAMERIRRRVLPDATKGETFSTAYTTYYVHQAVRYPRYVCYDCHRPGQWAWWDGFDPYYAQCSVFDMRVNWSWYWGPAYWYGYVPYFVYAYRPTCPPRYIGYYHHDGWYSSWSGWNRWVSLWGVGALRRYKSAPPPGYQPPSKFGNGAAIRGGSTMPPGFLTANVARGRSISPMLPVGRISQARGEGAGPAANPLPGVRTRRPDLPWVPHGSWRPAPAGPARGEGPPGIGPARQARPAPAIEAPRQERPSGTHAGTYRHPAGSGRGGQAREGGGAGARASGGSAARGGR